MLKILIINISDNIKLTEFAEDIKNKTSNFGFESNYIHYTKLKRINLKYYDSFIFSPTLIGKHSEFDDKEWNSKLSYISDIFDIEKPILGICGGHILIGKYFGSNIIIDKEKEIGENQIINIIKEHDPIFEGLNCKKIRVKQIHNNSIDLPEDFTLLATSKTCKIQLMKSNKYKIYSSQFHIEANENLFFNYLHQLK